MYRHKHTVKETCNFTEYNIWVFLQLFSRKIKNKILQIFLFFFKYPKNKLQEKTAKSVILQEKKIILRFICGTPAAREVWNMTKLQKKTEKTVYCKSLYPIVLQGEKVFLPYIFFRSSFTEKKNYSKNFQWQTLYL